jgi:opacity protein-like surface antigen
MRKIFSALAATSAFAFILAAPANAQESGLGNEGFYVALSGSADFANSGEFDGVQTPATGVPGTAGSPASVAVDYDTGYAIRGAIGYEFKKGLLIDNLVPRAEIEFEYGENDVGSGAFNAGNQSFSGGISRYAVKASLYNDIRWAADQAFIPYFGGGIGIGVVDADIAYFPNNGTASAPTFGVQGSATTFTTHSAIGATYKLTDQIEIFGEGRYTDYGDGAFQRVFVANSTAEFSADLEGDSEVFAIGAGLRFRF